MDQGREPRPVTSTTRAPLFAARALNATGQFRVALSLRLREIKSSLWATAGEKGLKSAHNDPRRAPAAHRLYRRLERMSVQHGLCAGPSSRDSASWPVQRALLTPQVDPGSRHRYSKSIFKKEQPVSHDRRRRDWNPPRNDFRRRCAGRWTKRASAAHASWRPTAAGDSALTRTRQAFKHEKERFLADPGTLGTLRLCVSASAESP